MKMGGRMNNLIKIIEQFKNKKIIVIGDVMLDKYIWGSVSRISPEAPVQIVNVTKESYSPGGAANVANNIAALNSKPLMVGIVGNDETRDKLILELKKRNIDVSGLINDENKRTIQKVRVLGRNQQLLRFDYEKKGYVSKYTEKKMLDVISKKIQDIDAIIVSDYAKGVITKSLMEKLKTLCSKNNKIIVVDPKPENKDFYKDVTLVTPNHTEARQMANFPEENLSDKDIENLGKQLLQKLKSSVLITKGEKGMSLFEKDSKITNIPTFAKEVYDIIGAGDTVVATLVLALASKASLEEAAIIANHAAGITVGKIGTSTVSIEELKERIENG
jgi:D-beta-D-heptose 7-phosphate kinase/D-beta-D-heptose 1-phosphate adenosyltransferase